MKTSNLKSILLAATLAAGSAFADSHVEINGILSLPLGDFKDSGLASTGFGGNLEYRMSLPNMPLEWVTDLSAFMHLVDIDAAKQQISEQTGIPASSLEMTGGKYIDIPLLTGLRAAAAASRCRKPTPQPRTNSATAPKQAAREQSA